MTRSTISRRAQENLSDSSNIMLEGVRLVNSNKYHAHEKADGIINLGVAENQLMTEDLSRI
ncbi:hypothetical protein BGZ94_006627, partial [Podila epigama]